jgi:hypothetical protein
MEYAQKRKEMMGLKSFYDEKMKTMNVRINQAKTNIGFVDEV